MQDISMQLDRLEGIIDGLYNRSESMLGNSDTLTKQALKAVAYLHGLKCDWEELQRMEKEKEQPSLQNE